MNIEFNDYNEYELSPQYLADTAKLQAQLDLIPRITRIAKAMDFNFNFVAALFEGPALTFEFADFATAACAKQTTFHGVGTTNHPEYQSFEIMDLVLLRSSPKTDFSYWLDLTALPCSKKNAKLINEIFEDCWVNNTELPVGTLAQLLDFTKLKSDDGLEWRKVINSFHYNNGNPAAQLLDTIVAIPQRINALQIQLEDFLILANIIRPSQHKTESVNNRARSPRIFETFTNSKSNSSNHTHPRS